MIEQLHATRLQLAKETAPGNGEPDGNFCVPPTVAAAVTRSFRQVAARSDVFRQPRGREIISEAWLIRSTHEVGLAFFRWILEAHLTDRGGGVWTLDPEAEGPTYVLETETQQGRRATFLGMKLTEVQLIFEESRLVRFELQWAALRRLTPNVELPHSVGLDLSSPPLPTWAAQAAATAGAWDADPRATQAINAHGAQLFLAREIEATAYGPDGIPAGHTRAAWQVVGECYMPETEGITDTAFSDDWRGKLGFWFGAGTEHLRINNAQGFVADDDLKGYDFHVRRLVIQGFSDDRRAVLEFRE